MSVAAVPANGHDQREAELFRQHAAAMKIGDLKKAHGVLTTLLALRGDVERPRHRTPAEVVGSWREHGPLVHEPTGIAALDELTGGGPVYGTRWYVVGAPDAGKTLFLLQLAAVFAGRGVAVGLCAVDEEADDVVTRLAQRAGWARAHCEARDPGVLDEMREALDALPIRLYDETWTIEAAATDLGAYARELGTGGFLGVDSIQTVECELERLTRATGRELSLREAVTARVRAVRKVATAHRLITVCTSEMNRAAYRTKEAAETANDMASSAESRAPEFSARVLLSLRSVPSESDMVDLKVSKNKHGPRDKHVFLRLDRRAQTLTETTYTPQPSEGEPLRDDRARERVTQDAAAVAAILLEKPALGSRELRAEMRARTGAGVERVEAALALLGDAVERSQGSRGARPMTLRLEGVPEAVRKVMEASK